MAKHEMLEICSTFLYQIFFQESWASFVPHLMIGLSIILFGLQLIFTRQKKTIEE